MMATITEHEHDLEIEAPCCSGRDSEGNISCGCYGQYSVACVADNCPGLTDDEVNDAIEAHLEPPEYEHDD